MIETEAKDAGESQEATVKETPDNTPGTESVASEGQKPEDQAGSPRGDSEGSKADGQESRPAFRTKLDTIRELRAKLRERDSYWRNELETQKSRLQELEERIAQSGRPAQKPSRTFWEAPEEVLDEKISGKLSEFEKRILDRMSQKESLNQETAEWKQETIDATEYIRKQKGVTKEDEEDIAAIIQENPGLMTLRPMDRAKFSLLLWEKERGIGDRSQAKARAATVQGQPPPSSGKGKIWTGADISAEMAKFPKDQGAWTKEHFKALDALEAELRSAQSDGRVK